jgi:hypothetical protein
MESKVTIKKLRVPVYKTSLWIVTSKVLVHSIDAVEDIIDHKVISDFDKKSTKAYVYAYEQHNGKYRVLVFLNNNSRAGTIAHECHHAMNIILKWSGVIKSKTNDEHESYLLEWLVDQAHEVIKKSKYL